MSSYTEFVFQPHKRSLSNSNNSSLVVSTESSLKNIEKSMRRIETLLLEKRPPDKEKERNNITSVLGINLYELGYLINASNDKVDLTKHRQIFSSDYKEVFEGSVVKNLMRCEPVFDIAVRCSQARYTNAFTFHFQVNLLEKSIEYKETERVMELVEYKEFAKEIFDESLILVDCIGIFLLRKVETDLKCFLKWSIATGVNFELHSH
jgi:hypothetical protein